VFFGLLAFASVFISFTAGDLPEHMASHFNRSGAADGFMPRTLYIRLMLGVAVGLPLILVLIQTVLVRKAPHLLNLPNKGFWLSGDRKNETQEFLESHTVTFGNILVLFLCFVHRLVVAANHVDPPSMPARAITAGLGVFIAATVVWIGVLILRFRKKDR
jgi:uncharacterized membrane protein